MARCWLDCRLLFSISEWRKYSFLLQGGFKKMSVEGGRICFLHSVVHLYKSDFFYLSLRIDWNTFVHILVDTFFGIYSFTVFICFKWFIPYRQRYPECDFGTMPILLKEYLLSLSVQFSSRNIRIEHCDMKDANLSCKVAYILFIALALYFIVVINWYNLSISYIWEMRYSCLTLV